MNKKELKKRFPYLTMSDIEFYLRHNEYKTERGFLANLQKRNDENERRANKKDVLRVTITIEWKRSRVWGYNPHASAWVKYADGGADRFSGYTCGGCGYDKESTVVSQIFNEVLSGMLYRLRNTKKEKPYGIILNKTDFPSFEGGVGMTCYFRIVEFLGGKMVATAHGDHFDQYDIEFKARKKA